MAVDMEILGFLKNELKKKEHEMKSDKASLNRNIEVSKRNKENIEYYTRRVGEISENIIELKLKIKKLEMEAQNG